MTVVAAGIGAGTSLAVAGVGMYNANKSKKQAERDLQNLKQPEYIIPQELKDNLSDAENRTLEGLPSEQKQEFVKNLDRNSVANLKASSERKGGLMGLQAQTSAANDAYTNLVSMDAAAMQRDKQLKKSEINNARILMANAKNTSQGLDRANYQAELAGIQGDYQAAGQNQNNAMMSMANTAANFAGSAMKRTPKAKADKTNSNIPNLNRPGGNFGNNMNKSFGATPTMDRILGQSITPVGGFGNNTGYSFGNNSGGNFGNFLNNSTVSGTTFNQED